MKRSRFSDKQIITISGSRCRGRDLCDARIALIALVRPFRDGESEEDDIGWR